MTLFRILATHPLLYAMGRVLLPTHWRRRYSGRLASAPITDHFRTLLSATAAMDAVPGRVVLVAGSLQPGGSERQIANTLSGLAGRPAVESLTLLCDFLHAGTKEQYDFYLPLAQQSGATIREIRRLGNGRGHELPAGFQAVMGQLHPGLAIDVANLFYEFRTLRPSVVHAWLDWSNVRAGLAAVLAGVPRVILSGRNLNPGHFTLNTDYFHPAYTALLEREQDQVVLLNNSQAGAEDYAAWLSLHNKRIRVVRNGVHLSNDMRPAPEQNAAFRAKLGIPEGAPTIGGMFRFCEEKRPLLWLEAAGVIAQALPQAHLVVFGQGDMQNQMETLIADLGIGARTHLCGTVTPSVNGLALCDLIMLTSRGEGTPNVLLEAQWLGLSVVTTAAGGAAEALHADVTGLVVKTDDASDIADAVLRILKDDKFISKARAEGPAFVTDRYGMGRMIEETLSIYQLDEVA